MAAALSGGAQSPQGSMQLLHEAVANQSMQLAPTQLSSTQLWSTPPAAVPQMPLLTGATGFLGSRILLELRQRGIQRVTVLVRAADRRRAWQRVATALARHGAQANEHRHAVELVCGDLASSELGVTTAAYQHLATHCDSIIHCAAGVDMVADYADLEDVNVAATTALLRLAQTGRPKRFEHMSSLAVFVNSNQPEGDFFEHDPLCRDGHVHGGYAQTKWVAEGVVRAAAAVGANVYRLGLLTGDSVTGVGNANDWLSRFIQALHYLPYLPNDLDPELAFDVTPVDYAAAAIAALALQPNGDSGTTYHICGQRTATLKELVAALIQAGVAIETISSQQFDERLTGALAQADGHLVAPLALALPRARKGVSNLPAMNLFAATRARFDDHRTGAWCLARGIHAPQIDQPLLMRYINDVFTSQGRR